ncbi:MAG: hypothetical protein ABSE49_21515, partial [Polyangiaceae bacterium]
KTEDDVLAWYDDLKGALGLNLEPGDPLSARMDQFVASLKRHARYRTDALAEYAALRREPARVLQSVEASSKKPRKAGPPAPVQPPRTRRPVTATVTVTQVGY